MKKFRTLITLLLLTVHLTANAQLTYNVTTSTNNGVVSYEIDNSITTYEGVNAIITYNDNSETGELLKFQMYQVFDHQLANKIISQIDKNAEITNGNTKMASSPIVFFFKDGKSVKEDCMLLIHKDVPTTEKELLASLTVSTFSLMLLEDNEALIKMGNTQLQGIQIYGHRFNFVIFDSVEALKALRKAAGTTNPKLNIASLDDVQVYVDDSYVGQGFVTPRVSFGPHTVELRRKGFRTIKKEIHINSRQGNSVVETHFQQLPTLAINVADGISIYIDDKYVASGSTTQYVDYGSHKVEFKKEKYHTVTKTININSLSGNTITVNSLEPIVGSMNITSTPAGMTVKLDGEEKGITPLIIKDVIIGNHKVELSKVHYYTETKDVEVKESEQSRVNMKMTEYARIKFTTNIYGASVYVDGQYIGSTPTTQDVVAGRHTFRVEGYHHRPNVRTITVSGNTGDQYFRLSRQYQRKNVFYIEPTFQCVSLNAIGGTIGFYAANVNFEGTYLYGLDKTAPIYWIGEDPNELYTPYEYTYKPSFAGGKIGYGFIIGTRVRITPQIGAGVLMINGSGDYGKSRGQAILGSGGLRLECALAPCLNLVAEPEYSLPLTKSDNYKSISEVSSKLGRWEKGFNCRIGLSLFW